MRSVRMDMEEPDRYIMLRCAAHVAGLRYPTLKAQATPRHDTPQWLRLARVGPRTVPTTQRWLHEYLTGRDEANTRAAPLPEGSQAPE